MPLGGRKGIMSKLNWKQYEVTVVRKQIAEVPVVNITSPKLAVEYFWEHADEAMGESLFVGHVDGRNNLIGFEHLYKGTATGLSINLYEIFRSVFASGAAGFFLLHNHPSGDTQSSDQDVQITVDTLAMARKMDIEFLDHLVVGKNEQFTSIRSVKPNIWAGDDYE